MARFASLDACRAFFSLLACAPAPWRRFFRFARREPALEGNLQVCGARLRYWSCESRATGECGPMGAVAGCKPRVRTPLFCPHRSLRGLVSGGAIANRRSSPHESRGRSMPWSADDRSCSRARQRPPRCNRSRSGTGEECPRGRSHGHRAWGHLARTVSWCRSAKSAPHERVEACILRLSGSSSGPGAR